MIVPLCPQGAINFFKISHFFSPQKYFP
uniref:Uncharacterized protein n=1 Tax=Magnetococcus massalia (strain MO-1) TaxID=451514 RepID=A0A1S7LQC2_MAGMO|nr:protein of unknown function [Candidatus Magnetococcus massalia]